MAIVAPRTRRDDRVLGYTRALSAVIIPFLLTAFAVLYLFPKDTKRLFAWSINSPMTAMVLASAYLGGAYFFIRVLREPRWTAVKIGFISVALFASLLGMATILHWDKFNHRHVAFWLWTGLYFTTPFLVIGGWLANQRFAGPASVAERRIGPLARWIVGFAGILAVVQGVVMFVTPSLVIGIWPWPLTPLTCRVLGAIFCLGIAGLGMLVDPRWATGPYPHHVQRTTPNERRRGRAPSHTPLAAPYRGSAPAQDAGGWYVWPRSPSQSPPSMRCRRQFCRLRSAALLCRNR
jgi:hypothetical protein